MALHLTGLSTEDLAEVVECLLVGADHCAGHAPELAAHRRDLAHWIGDSLDELPTSTELRTAQ
ncbi:hypothetical protein [Streptomyces sp. NPDC001091]